MVQRDQAGTELEAGSLRLALSTLEDAMQATDREKTSKILHSCDSYDLQNQLARHDALTHAIVALLLVSNSYD